jgi:hypothetical protein
MRASGGAAVQAFDDDHAVAVLFVGSTTEPGPGGERGNGRRGESSRQPGTPSIGPGYVRNEPMMRRPPMGDGPTTRGPGSTSLPAESPGRRAGERSERVAE